MMLAASSLLPHLLEVSLPACGLILAVLVLLALAGARAEERAARSRRNRGHDDT